jgi:5-methyltetrahydropteroyltriglutamate--homocysteine methyltransferase
MVQATNLGYPRIGKSRELKKALEQYWSGNLSETMLLEQAASLRKQHWLLQQGLGLQHIPSNDFSFYDQVLDMIALVGAIPERYNGGMCRHPGAHPFLRIFDVHVKVLS